MSKKAKSKPELNRMAGTCVLSQFFADRAFDEGINVPEGVTLRYEKINSYTYKLYATHPIIDFYGAVGFWTQYELPGTSAHPRFEDRVIADIGMTPVQTLRNFVNGTKQTLRNYKNIARIDRTFKFTDAHEAMAADLVSSLDYDEMGNPAKAVGFDLVFLRRAEEVGVSQDELENTFAEVFENLRQQENQIGGYSPYIPTARSEIEPMVRQVISNSTASELESKLNRRYRNLNTTQNPILKKLPPFACCIWGLKPLTTDIMIGNWNYLSSHTPTLISTVNIPESVRVAFKGKPVNDIVDRAVFGESQKIIHVAQLKNGKTTITMTPETKPFESKFKRAA